MAFRPIGPTTVFIAKPFEISHADAMRGLRVWGGQIGFELTLSTEQEALTFRRFGWLP
jgi:hypothetical protein